MEEEKSNKANVDSIELPKFYYEAKDLREPEHVADLGRECSALHHIIGSDITKKGNIHLITDDIFIHARGNSITFESIVKTNADKKYLLGIDDGGIGCIAVHPSR